jgi:hypothetical protein
VYIKDFLKFPFIFYIAIIISLCYLSLYIIVLGRQNRTLYLYVVTATNLSFRLRANAETSHSVRYNLVVVVMSIIGSGEKFSYGIVRS